jgi:hypothetical protein
MYNTSLDTLKQMGDVVKSLYEKVGDTDLFGEWPSCSC